MMRKLMQKLRATLANAGWINLGEWGGASTGPAALLFAGGLSKPAENSTMVYGCLMARREAIGSVELKVSDREDRAIESGPIVDLLKNPNSTMTWDQYVRALETYSTLYDAMVVLPVMDGKRISELIPLNPSALRPDFGIHTPSGTPVAVRWFYRDPWTGQERTFLPDEIMVHRGFNPYAPLASICPINVLKRTLTAEIASREQNLSLFRNDATPPFVLQTDKVITAEQAAQITDQWMARQGGVVNRGKPGVLWGGLKAEKLGLTPAEMEYLEGLKFLRNDYYMVFRVAPAMVGEMTGETGLSQGSSTDSQKVAWWENVGLAELGMIASLHERLLSGMDGTPGRALSPVQRRAAHRIGRAEAGNGLSIWFDDNTIPALVRQRLAKLDQFEKLARWGYRPDEIADWLDLGLPPHPVNVGVLPIGFQPAADMGAAPTAAAPVAPPEPPRALALLDGLRQAVEEDAARLSAKWQGVRKKLDQMLTTMERACARKWSRYFLEQRDRVLRRLEEDQHKGAKDAEGRSASDPLCDLGALVFRASEDLDAFFERLFPIDQENEAMLKRFSSIMVEQMQAGWATLNAEAGLAPDANPFQIDDPVIREGLEKRQVQATRVNDTTSEDLRSILKEAIDAGDTLTQISDRIAAYYKGTIGESSARPLAAARTQVAGAVNDGRLAAAQAVGGLKKAWLHGGSAEPREAHLAAQAAYMANPIGLDEKFKVNGYECDAPGDTALPAGEVINCSCMVIFTQGEA